MTSAPALIGLAHGSRDPRAASVIGLLLGEVARLRPGLVTAPAFLDLTEPDLSNAVLSLHVRRAVVVPLLFSRAFHARVDAPQAVDGARRQTGTDIRLAEILGLGPEIVDALESRLNPIAARETVLVAVGSSDSDANAAVVELAERWTLRRGSAVTATFATCEPRVIPALEAARARGSDVAVAPLFLAPGLLLDPVAAAARRLGVPVAEHLGTAVAALVLRRYDDAVATWDA